MTTGDPARGRRTRTREVSFRALGPLDARVDGEVVRLGGRKQRGVLAVLLLHANHVVAAERLIDAVWGVQPPPRAHSTLQVYVSTLRSLLDPQRRDREPADQLIARRTPGYVLRATPDTLDLLAFDQAAERGRRALGSGDHATAASALDAALALWRGPPLADLTDLPFHQAATLPLQERRMATLEGRIDADLALARHADVVAELERLVSEHPLRERLRGQLMLALARSGRQARALAVYDEARVLLATELGLDPSPELQTVHHAVLAQQELARADQAAHPALLFHDQAGVHHTVVLDPARAPVRIGRLDDNDVTLDWDREVSRHHAQLVPDDRCWWLRDVSRNGSFVNGARIRAPQRLADGDAITLGTTAVVFRHPTSRRQSPPDQTGETSLPRTGRRTVSLAAAEHEVLMALAGILDTSAVFDHAAAVAALSRRLGSPHATVDEALDSLCRQLAVAGLKMPDRLHRLVDRAAMLGLLGSPQ